MNDFGSFDWSTGTSEDQQNMARRLPADQLRKIARTYDWRLHPEEVLSWVMAQKSIDLGTALSAFLNGDPERFNYMSKRDVPDDYRAAARVLDNICLRVNSGFYLMDDDKGVNNEHRLTRWLKYQDVDRSEGRRGRWILDERIVDRVSEKPTIPKTISLLDNEQKPLWQDVLSPLKDLGVSRDHLKYLPAEYKV